MKQKTIEKGLKGAFIGLVVIILLIIIGVIAVLQVGNPSNAGSEIIQILAFTMLVILLGGPSTLAILLGISKTKGVQKR